jgi:hypothetical protein
VRNREELLRVCSSHCPPEELLRAHGAREIPVYAKDVVQQS